MVRILLVEDNPVDAFIAEKVVRLSGVNAQLEIADGGKNALDLLTHQYLETRELPDLILVDHHMPLQNGTQFLEAFAALDMPGKDRVVTLMLTSSADPHLIIEAIRRGAHGLISKPLSIEMLMDMIRRVRPKEQEGIQHPIN